jgi:hypothetical protein
VIDTDEEPAEGELLGPSTQAKVNAGRKPAEPVAEKAPETPSPAPAEGEAAPATPETPETPEGEGK